MVQAPPVVNNVNLAVDDMIVEAGSSYQVPQVGAEVELANQGDLFTNDMEEVDRLMEMMENEEGEDTNVMWNAKATRYKTMAYNLREKVKFLTKENEKITRINDLSQKKLNEYKIYSAAEVL